MADRTHAADEILVFEKALHLVTGELRAAIRMQDHRLAGVLTTAQRGGDRIQHQLTLLRRPHRPADHELAVKVDYHAQKQPAFGGADLGDIGHPFGVGLKRDEVALEMIGDADGSQPRWLVAPGPGHGDAVDAVAAHQACDPIETGLFAFKAEFFVHAPASHHAEMIGMDRPNAAQ